MLYLMSNAERILQTMKTIGITAMLQLVTEFLFIFLAFWSIQKLHIENLMRLYPTQARLLIVLLSVTIGFSCSEFLWRFYDNVRNLTFLIR
ncbi:DUF1146 family protein [Secundilactobacillus kimchicus]|uniref:DUF1146 family protein n=1 Tax=Secundilactobacillus kimchicus TaxID=528209 RepID=UPI002795AC83|nr:DUF1146 family protein [Secundilactobacillus kimchicus]